MGWQVDPNLIVTILNVVGAGDGVFVYDSATGQAPNGLRVSITGPSTLTDSEGNAIVGELTAYTKVSSSLYYAMSMSGDEIQFFTATSEAGPWTATGVSIVQQSNGLQINFGSADILFNSSTGAITTNAPLTVNGEPITSTGGTQANPTIITTDSWHAQTLTTPANWTVNNQPQCTFYPDNTVELQGEITAAAAIATGASLLTLPSGYFNPNKSMRLTANYNTGTASVNAVLLNISTAGVVTTFPAIPSGSTLNIGTRFSIVS